MRVLVWPTVHELGGSGPEGPPHDHRAELNPRTTQRPGGDDVSSEDDALRLIAARQLPLCDIDTAHRASGGIRESGGAMEYVPSVLILVLAVDRDPWRSIETEGQRRTWASQVVDGIAIRFYYGELNRWEGRAIRVLTAASRRAGLAKLRTWILRSAGLRYAINSRVLEVGDRLHIDAPEAYVTIGVKTHAAMRYVFEHHHFDFLFRTNTSSYVNLGRLAELVTQLPRAGIYAGVPMATRSGEIFLSGAGILMSHDVVGKVALDTNLDFSAPDDVAIARSATLSGVAMTRLGRIDLESLDQIDQITPEELRTAFHYRCKVRGDRSQDIVLMRKLHDRLPAQEMP